jgi:azurin
MKYLITAALLFLARIATADVCPLSIDATDDMRFEQETLQVETRCTDVEVTLHHTGKLPAHIMGHNWVLTKTADVAAVANAGMGAGLASNYVGADDKRVLAHTKVVGGGQSDTITFSTASLKAGGDYSYLCTFPGHNALMRGKFKFG